MADAEPEEELGKQVASPPQHANDKNVDKVVKLLNQAKESARATILKTIEDVKKFDQSTGFSENVKSSVKKFDETTGFSSVLLRTMINPNELLRLWVLLEVKSRRE